ncbi:von Willebrand factor A domain-containing protein 5A, partial [Paragonimus heterotremus]
FYRQAKTTFHEAVESGHTAFLAEEDERCEDVFQMNIGNVPPNGTVQIVLKYAGYLYVENLESDESQLSRATFSLPSVINPRYTPSSSAIIPEFDPFEEPVVSNSASYTLSFEASVSMPFDIVEVSSRIDKYSTAFKPDHKHAEVKLVSEFKPDHNLQMIISMSKPLRSFAVCEPGDSSKPTDSFLSMGCLMAQFVPDFSQLTIQQESRTELVFVIDRSGSMEGPSIECASESLLLFLKALPIGCRFQIIGFGSTHSALFPEPVDYNETTLARAVEYQKSMQADMGGTEVLPALQAAFDAPLTGHGWYRQIIFVTDGDVTNANEVIGLVGANVTKARVFTIGIQTGSSSHLIGTVARVGRGIAAFIEENSQLRRVVMKILRMALQPRASEIKVHWNLMNELNKNAPVNVITVPSEVPPVFHNQVITVYGLISAGTLAGLKGSVSLECEILDQKQTFSVNIPSTEGYSLYSSSADAPLHRLAGKYQLNELGDRYKTSLMNKKPEDDPEIKTLREQIEKISCAINVISPVTAMVGVDPVKRGLQVALILINCQLLLAYLAVVCFAGWIFISQSCG